MDFLQKLTLVKLSQEAFSARITIVAARPAAVLVAMVGNRPGSGAVSGTGKALGRLWIPRSDAPSARPSRAMSRSTASPVRT